MKKNQGKQKIHKKREEIVVQGDFIDSKGKKVVYRNHDNDKVIYFEPE